MKEELERIDSLVRNLGEHWNSVLVLCSKVSDDGDGATDHIARGSGNVFARVQQAREYIIHQDEITRLLAQEKFKESRE